MFNSEYTITWDEIAPSLQLLFKTLQSEIVDNHNKIMKNRADIDALDKRIMILENSDPFANLWLTGQQGQVVKIDKKEKRLYPHDEWLSLRVVDTPQDLEKMKKTKPDLISTIRDTWVGYAHYNTKAVEVLDNAHFDSSLQEGQNLGGIPYTDYTTRNVGWTVNNKGEISCNSKSVVVSGFMDPKLIYYNYALEYAINIDNNSGMVGILLGYNVDDNGVQHTLSFVRGPRNNTTNNEISFAVVYDLGNPTQEILSDHTLELIDPDVTNPDTKLYANIRIEKNNTLFKLQSTLFDPKKDNLGAYNTFEYEFNPFQGDYKKETFNNLTKMINNPAPVGVITRNARATFNLLSQKGILDSDDIYDLNTRKHYTYDYNTSQWKEEGTISQYLSNRIFVYNKATRKFFFHNYPGKYTEMDLFQSSIYETAEDGQVIKLNKTTGKAYPDNEFHVLCGYLLDADRRYIQDNMVNGKFPKEPLYDFPAGKILEYISGSWQITGNIKDKLAPRTLVYNKILKKLFFYKEDGTNGNNVTYIEY